MLKALFDEMGISYAGYEGADLPVYSPIDGAKIASLKLTTKAEAEKAIAAAAKAFEQWRQIPAPKRGELVRLLGEALRKHREPLGKLVTLECGKILPEGIGEVQEMIDICDFAVGLSRQLYGLTIASERSQHIMHENWYPLGVVGVISAFNFPVAVWAWNSALALVCGDAVVWKPSEKTPLTAIACTEIIRQVIARFNQQMGMHISTDLVPLLIGGADAGELLVRDKRIALVSATGSTAMGRKVAPGVQKRFGKLLLELGGNNAAIVTPKADLELALPSILFGAVGTAGQRCTTTRRLIVHESIAEHVEVVLAKAYESLIASKIGNPLDEGTIIAPLIDEAAGKAFDAAIAAAKHQGGRLLAGGKRAKGVGNGCYVEPALISMPEQSEIVLTETFAPILYILRYKNLDEALAMHNAAHQGLSSCIFTQDIAEAEYFRQHSDCGIANVNIGTSGAEIGGAFGGEKETGGGRESGSDAWKAYMRRQTSTIYYGRDRPELAQGIVLDL